MSTRVLIVDDNTALRESLQLVLSQAGYEVETARDGGEAVQVQASHPADVLLTDIFMPDRDGIETIQLFRSRYPAMGIIAMSGDAHFPVQTDYLQVAEVAGANFTLRKPFKPQALLEKLRELKPQDKAG
jgi:CheY-like chemotaxis protein